MAECAVQIGRFDIRYALTSLNRFSEALREGHLSRLAKIFGYLKSVTGRRKCIVFSPEDIEDISGKGANAKDWLEKYPGASDKYMRGSRSLGGALSARNCTLILTMPIIR